MAKSGRRRYGEGSVYQRKDGRWVAEITLEDRSRKQFYFRTEKEAVKKARTATNEKELGILATGPQQTVKQFLEYWLNDVHKGRIRPSTYQTYRTKVYRYLIPAFGHVQLQKLTTHQIHVFYSKKLEEGISSGTIRNIHAVLRKALSHAKREKLVSNNVCEDVEIPRYSQFEVEALTQEQAKLLLQKAKGHRLEVLLILALTTGMRKGELLALHWEDVSLETRTLEVRRNQVYLPSGIIEGKPKTKKGHRMILLTRFAVEALTKHYALQQEAKLKAGDAWIERDLVFCEKDGDYTSPQALQYRFSEFLKSIGLPHMRFHDLRHSVVTLLLAMGIDPKSIQQLVGHQDIATTLGVYGHVLLSMQHDVADKLDDLFNP